MANRLRYGSESTCSAGGGRHGRKGDVNLHVGVPGHVKDELVLAAKRDGVTLRALVNDALDFYLDAIRRRAA